MGNDTVPTRSDWSVVGDKVKFEKLSKEKLFDLYVKKTLLKTQKMFDYEGLPETLPKRFVELILQTWGYLILKKVNGEWYGFYGGLGGVPDAYYQPTKATIANPYLKYSATLEIDKECVVIRNDALRMGLMPMIERYAYLQAETDISFKFMAVNTRVGWIINTKSDQQKESAEKFLDNIEKGEKLGVIHSKDFDPDENLDVYNQQLTPNLIQHLIELKQYNEGTFLQEIGIQSAFNMKREAINEAEAALSTDILFPLIDEMLEEREEGWKKFNEMSGENVKVKLSSVWEHLRNTREMSDQIIETQIKDNMGVDEPSKEVNVDEGKNDN